MDFERKLTETSFSRICEFSIGLNFHIYFFISTFLSLLLNWWIIWIQAMGDVDYRHICTWGFFKAFQTRMHSVRVISYNKRVKCKSGQSCAAFTPLVDGLLAFSVRVDWCLKNTEHVQTLRKCDAYELCDVPQVLQIFASHLLAGSDERSIPGVTDMMQWRLNCSSVKMYPSR